MASTSRLSRRRPTSASNLHPNLNPNLNPNLRPNPNPNPNPDPNPNPNPDPNPNPNPDPDQATDFRIEYFAPVHHSGLPPQASTSETPEQACYSHVRALPWTAQRVRLHAARRRLRCAHRAARRRARWPATRARRLPLRRRRPWRWRHRARDPGHGGRPDARAVRGPVPPCSSLLSTFCLLLATCHLPLTLLGARAVPTCYLLLSTWYSPPLGARPPAARTCPHAATARASSRASTSM